MTAPFSWTYPTHIAHRGGGRLAPENTLAALRVGRHHGYRMAEFDVKLSRDGVAVLLHDDDLDRTTNGHGPAAARDYAELARLDAGSWHSAEYAGEPVPTFEAVARHARATGLACNVEIKPCPGRDAETGEAVARLAQRLWHGAALPPLLSSFSETALAAACHAAPGLPRALLVDAVPDDWAERLRQHGCVALNLNHKNATPQLVQAVHDAGYRLCLWTINDPERVSQVLGWGVDAIFTDELAAIRPAA